MRTLLDELAAATAPAAGAVPDLGPAALPDQLTVLVQDAWAAGTPADTLEDRLAALRRAL